MVISLYICSSDEDNEKEAIHEDLATATTGKEASIHEGMVTATTGKEP